ncbi:hypothetical protein [Shewanella sp. NIFS-20-20]|uniref:hypothetical protein n=1 Tax=Shewanella sp. NIFS-20-20 TaxID=2853806 RepID=UPI001C463F75|nr:hypothetical protein [Shewanella sp. NIFS-20-20]MBV7315747.1 hypothetical protein [Shewanella sp. NIFS-20-20]
MMGLDSLYAMLARPVTAAIKPKPKIERVSQVAPSAADDHQETLADSPNGLSNEPKERRKQDRRHQHRRQTEGEPERDHPPPAARQGGHIDIEI